MYNADLPPGAKACQHHSHAAEGVYTGSSERNKEQSDRLRRPLATAL